MRRSASELLARLEDSKARFGEGAAEAKLEILDGLRGRSLRTADEVARLHEALCFLRAYPDDARLLARVEAMLAGFARRADLRRWREALADSGIAGTEIRFPFFFAMANWLARRWPDRLSVQWDEFDDAEKLGGLLHLLVPYCETPGLDELAFDVRDWVRTLKGPKETDAAFLVRRFAALAADAFGRESIFESLDIPMRLAPGPDTPSRTRAKRAGSPVHFQAAPFAAGRPDLRREVRRSPSAVRPLTRREGHRMIDLAREAMVTRQRDLDVFANADPNDVCIVEFEEGLAFLCFGAVPERRLLLESVYGFLTLKNGVPIGYVLTSALFGSAGIAYNVFDTWRGAESARVYARVLAMVRHLFGCDSFYVDPYQLGHENEEGLRSGAWWFYYKLGFQPEAPDVLRILRGELARMRRDPRHRSSRRILQDLTAENVYLDLGRRRDATLGRLAPGNVGLAISRSLARRFGSDRERGLRVTAEEAAHRLGVRSLRGFAPGERLAWTRWSPLVVLLPGLERWSAAAKRALVDVIRAKGGRRESEFVARFDRHAPLRRAVARLAVETRP